MAKGLKKNKITEVYPGDLLLADSTALPDLPFILGIILRKASPEEDSEFVSAKPKYLISWFINTNSPYTLTILEGTALELKKNFIKKCLR